MRKLGADFWPCEVKGYLGVSNTEKAKQCLTYIEMYSKNKEIREKARLANSYLI